MGEVWERGWGGLDVCWVTHALPKTSSSGHCCCCCCGLVSSSSSGSSKYRGSSSHSAASGVADGWPPLQLPNYKDSRAKLAATAHHK